MHFLYLPMGFALIVMYPCSPIAKYEDNLMATNIMMFCRQAAVKRAKFSITSKLGRTAMPLRSRVDRFLCSSCK
jgi:hypothetical protein